MKLSTVMLSGLTALFAAAFMWQGCNSGVQEETKDAAARDTGIDGGKTDRCTGVSCSGHGVCALHDGEPVCACDKGYYADGLECLWFFSDGGRPKDDGGVPQGDGGGDAGTQDAGADGGTPTGDGGLDGGDGDAGVCEIPYRKTGKLLCWSGTMLAGLVMKETATYKDADLPAYYDALAADGVNAERNMVCLDSTPEWELNLPWIGDDLKAVNEEFYRVLDRRMALVAARDLTEIITVGPYSGYDLRGNPDFPGYVREFVKRMKKWLPNIIFETWNEPVGSPDEIAETQKQMVTIFQEEGVPDSHIQIAFADGGKNSDILMTQLGGEGLMSLHWIGSMETVQQVWEPSSNYVPLMGYGLYGSDDGQDTQRSAHGLNWWWHEQQGITEYRRPDNDQIYEITKWMLTHGRGVGYEHLSAAGFQTAATPNLEEAIRIGKDERKAMYRAYCDTLK